MNNSRTPDTHAGSSCANLEDQSEITGILSYPEKPEEEGESPTFPYWQCYWAANIATESSDAPKRIRCYYCPDTSCSRKTKASDNVSPPTEGHD